MCNIHTEWKQSKRKPPPLYYRETGVCTLGETVQHHLHSSHMVTRLLWKPRRDLTKAWMKKSTESWIVLQHPLPPPRMDLQIATWSMIATFRNWHKKLLGKKTLLLHQMTEVSGNVFCCRRGQNLSFERFVCVYSTDGSCLTSIFCK